MTKQELTKRIAMERWDQDKKWGKQQHPPEKWLTILSEEVGEVAQAILQNKPKQVEKELIQAAAVIECWLTTKQ